MPARHHLEVALDNLIAAVEAEEHRQELGLWAVAALAHKLGISFALSDATEPLAALADIGGEWAEHVSGLLEDRPEEQADTLRAVYGVVQRVVDDVRRRGLTRDRQSRLRA